ncbi:hypothetical protein ACISK3_03695 [Morganella morganii]|nr:hypothetical protein [Morganella morganii]
MTILSVPVKAADFSTNHPNSSAALFSSAVISGIILLPLLIPAQICALTCRGNKCVTTSAGLAEQYP